MNSYFPHGGLDSSGCDTHSKEFTVLINSTIWFIKPGPRQAPVHLAVGPVSVSAF